MKTFKLTLTVHDTETDATLSVSVQKRDDLRFGPCIASGNVREVYETCPYAITAMAKVIQSYLIPSS